MVPVTSGLAPRFDVLDPALLEDPYPAYRALRDAAAVCRAGPATVAIPRYADVAALLRHPGLGHQLPGRESLAARLPGGGFRNTQLSLIVSALDPPDHSRVRRLLARAVSPEVVASARRRAQDIAAALLDAALSRGRADAVTDLALPLQIAFASGLLGIPAADRDEVCRQALELGRAIIMVPFVTAERGNGDPQARWMRDYLAALLAARRQGSGDDVLSRLARARHDGAGLSPDELIDNAVFLFFAGFESSVHLMAGGCAVLAQAPGELARLRADPELVPAAVEEILRYDAPLQWVSRMTETPVTVAGQEVRASRVVLLMLGSANRDERQFAAPDRLDVGRQPNAHLSFGGGIHHCLGVSVARMLGAVFFGELARRRADLALTAPPVRRHHPNLRSYASVPLALAAGP
jgi:cytochrome P450